MKKVAMLLILGTCAWLATTTARAQGMMHEGKMMGMREGNRQARDFKR